MKYSNEKDPESLTDKRTTDLECRNQTLIRHSAYIGKIIGINIK